MEDEALLSVYYHLEEQVEFLIHEVRSPHQVRGTLDRALTWVFIIGFFSTGGCDLISSENRRGGDHLDGGEWESLDYPGADIRNLHTDGNTLYVAGGRDGVFRIRLGVPGTAWSYLGFADTTGRRTGVTDIDARDADLLLSRATIDQVEAVWRSRDRGVSWTPATQGMSAGTCNSSAIWSVERSPHDPSKAIAARGALFQSTDGGTVWKITGMTPPCAEALNSSISWNPFIEGEAWVVDDVFAGPDYIPKTDDYGGSWYNPLFDSTLANSMELAFTDAGVLLSVGGRLYQSSKSDTTLELLCNACTEELTYDPSNGGSIYASWADEMRVSVDGGRTFSAVISPFTSDVRDLQIAEDLRSIFIATHDSIYRYWIR